MYSFDEKWVEDNKYLPILNQTDAPQILKVVHTEYWNFAEDSSLLYLNSYETSHNIIKLMKSHKAISIYYLTL